MTHYRVPASGDKFDLSPWHFCNEDGAAPDADAGVARRLAEVVGLLVEDHRAARHGVLTTAQRHPGQREVQRAASIRADLDVAQIAWMRLGEPVRRDETVRDTVRIEMAARPGAGIR
ncbi:MAG: hypothetical protein A3B78_02095 [Omnitrophica WOR_2 bacterium RIFCSPHIGHO2_02_FULL_67_20]|nr:MAG: hypothetical protein A3B78_02095 [Omnitrophica WOR_2 bacterium RIFCSPHIGHO2_02_FULL_67_20]